MKDDTARKLLSSCIELLKICNEMVLLIRRENSEIQLAKWNAERAAEKANKLFDQQRSYIENARKFVDDKDRCFSGDYPYELRFNGDSAEFLGNDRKWHPIDQFDDIT